MMEIYGRLTNKGRRAGGFAPPAPPIGRPSLSAFVGAEWLPLYAKVPPNPLPDPLLGVEGNLPPPRPSRRSACDEALRHCCVG
jgi:hypothetical protein